MTASLMYVPLPATIESEFRDTFIEELETMTMQEIVESTVALVTNWQNLPDPLTRRIARNLSIIHGKDELCKVIERHINTILGGPVKTKASEAKSGIAVSGQQTDPLIPLIILGAAIAIWLIGWAITGKCDWYMGSYSP